MTPEQDDYIPYGEEWKKEMMKLPKAIIIDLAAKSWVEKDKEIAELRAAVMNTEEIIDIKESIIQELISALEASNDLLVKDGYGQERLESNYQLIQKYKL